MSNVRRVYVEKKPSFAVKAKELKHEISSYLGIKTVTNVRELIRYDVENISDDVFEKACHTVFAEPPVDDLYLEKFEAADGAHVFSVQCVQFLDENAQPIIRSATTYVIEGDITEEEFEAIRNHCINPVDSRETGLQKPETLVKLSDIGVKIPELVIGGTVKPAEGEEAVKLSQRAYAKPDDIEAYKKLKAAGTKLYAQYVPADAEVSIDEFLK